MPLDPTLPEFKAFVRQMGASRQDDTCRLVFCDWLEERGHTDFATLFRAMLDINRSDPDNRLTVRGWDGRRTHDLIGPVGPYYAAARALARTWQIWKPLKHLGPASLLWKWHRGTIDELVIDWEAWALWHHQILAFGPVGELVLHTRPRMHHWDGQADRIRTFTMASQIPGRPVMVREFVVTERDWLAAHENQRWRTRDAGIEGILRREWPAEEVGVIRIDDEALNAVLGLEPQFPSDGT